VLAAATGAEAQALAADHDFNLLLTDLVMPEISGVQLAERIRQLRPGVALLSMSGYSQDVLGQQYGLDESIPLIQKPFTGQTLLQGVRAAIRGACPAP
jgi:DNA-binding response OmpR family regulator